MKIPKVFFLGFLWIVSSCQYFNTERISSETFYEEEIESINWSEVDTYPMFGECEKYTEKEEQKSCFQNVVNTAIKQELSEENLVTSQEISDTVTIILQIDKKGNLDIEEVIADSLTLKKIPSLSRLFQESIGKISNPAPAYKRGIPVTTTIRLPFILNSENL